MSKKMKMYDMVKISLINAPNPTKVTATSMIKMIYAGFYGIGPSETLYSVLNKIAAHEVPSLETIRRSLQKVREDNPALRFEKQNTESGYDNVEQEAKIHAKRRSAD